MPGLPTGIEREHFEQETTEIIETVSLGWICIVRNNERPRVVIVRSDGDGEGSGALNGVYNPQQAKVTAPGAAAKGAWLT